MTLPDPWLTPPAAKEPPRITSPWPRRLATTRLILAGVQVAGCGIGAAGLTTQHSSGMGGLGIAIMFIACMVFLLHGLVVALLAWLGLRAARKGSPHVWAGIVIAVLDLPLLFAYGLGLPIVVLDVAWAVSARRSPDPATAQPPA